MAVNQTAALKVGENNEKKHHAQAMNRKLTVMNKLLMEENDRLQKQVSQLIYENNYFRQQTQNTTLATTDTSCESVVTSGQHHLTPQHPLRDATCRGNFNEFLSKAIGTAIEWVQMPGMKLGPDSIESLLFLMVAVVWQHVHADLSLKSLKIGLHGIVIAELWMLQTCCPLEMVEPLNCFICRLIN
ncbi:homeobox-leucine zipper protein ATHB-8-like [Gossypium arboreum]|uniref:homeobox-leucine zipper protein ATHB-8-like n=1 Tax=Gossypium arboreum TaxID=29729 RepID=UPI0022F1610C|nr:homeobox-leucine zipper protein ATHB-8-like [Gossypium arboreum]